MRNIVFAFCGLFVFFVFATSCEDMMGDFLDKAPGIDVTEDTIFSSKVEVEKFIAGTYERGLSSTLPLYDTYHPDLSELLDNRTDEGEGELAWRLAQRWNQGAITDGNSGEDQNRFRYYWDAIRRCNILLERVEDLSGLADQAYIDQVKGEALFIRAHCYDEMLIRYGGVPIIDRRFQLDDDFYIPRSSVEETVKFIVKDCSDAASLLPETYLSAFRGRITRTAALALKSRVLLFAASPLFNSATPYLDFGANNKLICYENADNNRWQLAADAAKAALDAGPGGGFSLVTDKGADKNYRYVWEINDNSEVILANKLIGNAGFWQWPANGLIPKAFKVSWGGASAPHNFVQKYEKKDGTPQTWDPDGGSDLLKMYSELDPRFYQTMAPVGSKWSNALGIVQSHVGGKHVLNCLGGVWIHKWSSYDASWGVKPVPNNILFRVAELYLNYAEALNEAQGPVAAAYDAVNTIRNRSGMPDLPAGLSKDEFRERIRNERTIELAYEGFRFWDIRRWKIAEDEGVMQGKMWGVKTYQIPGSSEYRYEPYVFETRIFYPKMYLHPWPRAEVLKGYIVQNPGY